MTRGPNNQPGRSKRCNPCASTAQGASKRQIATEIARKVAIVEATADTAIIAKDMDGTIVTWNTAAKQLYGYTPAEILGRSIAVLVPPEAWDEFEHITEKVKRGQRICGLETVRQRKDGSRVLVSLTLLPLHCPQGDVIGSVVMVRDLSEVKEREAEIFMGRARLRSILDTAVDAIITIDGHGLIQTMNPATSRLFGYTAAELVGQNVKVLMPSPYQEEHDGYLARYIQTGEKRIIGIGREVRGLRKDGSEFPIDVAVSEVEPGKLFTGIIRDLSERKMLEENLRQADRMATIGTMAAGLGHDINNLLLVLNASEDVLDTCPLPPNGATAVQSLRDATDYLRNLARGLRLIALDPANRGDRTSETTCLTDWYPATEALLKTMARPGIAIELKIPPHLPDVAIASHQLTQIVFNLVCNAVNAIADAPRAGDGLVQVSAVSRSGNNGVRLKVADNGCGMAPEVFFRAFEPLFTTRAGRGGTGLGLPLVKRLISDAGGAVTINSKPGIGTTVTVDLCAAPAAATRSLNTADGPTAVVSVADAHAAALIRRVLRNLDTPVRSDNDHKRAHLWIVDPAAVDLRRVQRWTANGERHRRLVLFGKPPTRTWEALQPLVITDTDDFESIRRTIACAVTAG